MFVQDYATAERRAAAAHRGGGIAFMSLLKGDEGALDNFDLMLVDMTQDYVTPRHRHNFDQVRIMLQGYFEWAPGTPQPEGSIGYFPEGTYYTQKGIGPSRTLVLQVGGGSGGGYMSHRQLQDGIGALQRAGSFDDGVYTGTAADGTRQTKDGYQAVWEHVHGRALSYPQPRYQTPLIAFPDAFAWHSAGDRAAVRRFGSYNEVGLSMAQLRIDAGGSVEVGDDERPHLLYVAAGEGDCAGTTYGAQGAIRVERGEKLCLNARGDSLFYQFGLPTFGPMAI